MAFTINNRRYTGSKSKLTDWIRNTIQQECDECNSFFDIFAGTGVVTHAMIDDYDHFILNDFLYSNEVIYNAFFGNKSFNQEKLIKIAKYYRNLNVDDLEPGYVTKNYGKKYFAIEDALKIDYIREDIEKRRKNLNKAEYNILLASLIYSFDRSANTVGHYDAYIKSKSLRPKFNFELISPVIKSGDKRTIKIYREDANSLASKVTADIVYIDPPYSSRQYSRFYHVIETITKWDKPDLFGEALKPEPENMSEYCKTKAIDYFNELIVDLKAKYIVVSYNNTYTSKSKSSKNKMTLEEITEVLNRKGATKVYAMNHKAFNAGKTDLNNHQEMLFITKVGK